MLSVNGCVNVQRHMLWKAMGGMPCWTTKGCVYTTDRHSAVDREKMDTMLGSEASSLMLIPTMFKHPF